MKHYRPFRYIRNPFLILTIIAACLYARTALAQAESSVGTAISVQELNRKGGEAVDRKDYKTAFECFRRSAEQGDAIGQYWFGESYLFGWGVAQSNADAVLWHRKAAEQGNAAAEYRMGQYYKKGDGVPRDYSESVRWLRKAADQGNADGQMGLGVMYREGLGVARDKKQAFMWLLKSAEQGNMHVQNTVGYFYLGGEGTTVDYARAMFWFQKAAAQGFADAQIGIATLYQGGFGVPEDHEQARIWYEKAIAQDDEKAKKRLAEMEAEDRNASVTRPDKLPPALHFICVLDNPQVTNITRLNKTEQDAVALKYRTCLRSNWKRINGSVPFPGD